MTAETVTAAVEKRQPDNTPGALVRAYSNDFAAVLPTHIKAATWVRLAQGALKKGKKVQHPKTRQPCTELELAASNNPSVFLASLLDAARLGLEPGTEQYYLTPRKVGGKLEILGIVGYQGYIELMYRAGAISSVVAEVVYSGDKFSYKPGVDERPDHEIDWDAEDRGDLRLVYAYAVMKDGATSRVVVMNKAAIDKVKKSSQGSNSEYSPWVQHEAAMWLKSSVRQLAKWVPTSAEYIREQIRAARDIAAEDRPPQRTVQDVVDAIEGDVVDAEVIEDSPEYQAHVADHDAPAADCKWCDADLVGANGDGA